MSDSYQDALAAVEAARAGLEDNLIAAKAAYLEDQSEENRARKAAAVAELQAARAADRAVPRPLVVADVAAGVDKAVHPSGVPAGLTTNLVLDDFPDAPPPAEYAHITGQGE